MFCCKYFKINYKTRLFFILILLSQTIYSQKIFNKYLEIDKKALLIPDSLTTSTDGIASYINSNFNNDNDKSRAIFIWIAKNIKYDIDNMFTINFYEKREAKIEKVLKTKKGICEHYSALFTEICLKSGIKSFVIEGYTKQNGFTDYIPHAWCTAYIDTAWYIFEPTWGSGYIENGKFYKEIDNQYYKALPTSIIKTHMPFDYLWQFINYPITNKEFCDSKIQTKNLRPLFHYNDSILLYEKQSEIERLKASARRIEKNGVQNSLIFDRLQHIKREIEIYNQNQIKDIYQLAIIDYNNSIRLNNDFIHYKNKQFIPIKSDSEIQIMVDSVNIMLNKAKDKLNGISSTEENVNVMISQLLKSVNEISAQAKEELEWLALYFSKSKKDRNGMFYVRNKSN